MRWSAWFGVEYSIWMLFGVSSPMAVDTLTTEPSAGLVGQLINAFREPCLLDDSTVIPTRPANLGQMWADQRVSLFDRRSPPSTIASP
ncbi:MAG: hypothetical protein FJ387_27850 [Verrucomicrobia bacterium]|nr:hypothetical protein [Verrucomicrobiota bacterium]